MFKKYFFYASLVTMKEIFIETFFDTLRIFPVLCLTYALIELAALGFGKKALYLIGRTRKTGPVAGAVLGLLPQCGLSAALSEFFSHKAISAGTLVAVFISSSDEMIPIMLSKGADLSLIFKISAVKFVIGIVFGYFSMLLIRNQSASPKILSPNDKSCACTRHILLCSLKHAARTALFLFFASFSVNTLFSISYIDGSFFLKNDPLCSSFIFAALGLIPGCAPSVAVSELYLDGIIDAGSLIAALCTASGSGLITLIRTNKNTYVNLAVLAILFMAGCFAGIIIKACGISF